MTNLRKSYVPVFAVIALAFCIIMIGQVMADSRKLELFRATTDDVLGVPLPSEEVLVSKPAIKHVQPKLVAIPGEESTERPTAARAAASTENGGDTYATATVIAVVPYSDLGTTVGATYDYNAPCGSFDGAGDVVYQYTPPFSGTLFVSTCNAGSPPEVDTKIWVNESVTLTTVGCNDDDAACDTYASTVTAPVVAGLTYYIIVGAYGPGSESAFQIDVDLIVPGTLCTAPIEITYPVAESLSVHTYPVDLSIVTTPGNCSMTGSLIGRSVYFNFTAPVNGMYNFTWCDDGTVPLDPQDGYPLGRWTAIAWPACGLGAYGWAPNPLVNGSRCADNGPYTLTFVKVAGTTQLLEICTRSGELFKGTLTVTWEPLPLENDACADAQDLGTGATGDVFGHNLGATLDGPGIDGCSPSDPSEVCADVWYKWTADATGYARFDMCSGETDNKMWVYRGVNCTAVKSGAQESNGCSDDGCGAQGGPSFSELTCTTGEEFLIRIAGWYIAGDPTYGDCNAYGMGVFYINCEVFPTSIRPPNDSCKTAIPVLLADSVMYTEGPATTSWAGYDCVPHSIDYDETNTWHAFSINTCANVIMSWCGMPDAWYGTARYSTSSFLLAPIYTGCDCQGPVVRVYAAVRGGTVSGAARCAFFGFPTDAQQTKWFQFNSLIPGDYYAVQTTFYTGIYDGSWVKFIDYYVNFLKTPIPCVYCAATGNTFSCPPVAGATWLDRVQISGLNNAGPTGCHAYEDFTLLPGGKIYRGFSYTLNVGFGIQGTIPFFDATYMCHTFIDWNQNSGFAANQTELGEDYILARVGPNLTTSILVPMDAALPGQGGTGQTRMRVRLNLITEGSIPCGSNTWGEVEDYVLTVADISAPTECGDFNGDGLLTGDDIAFLRAFYFGVGTAPDIWQRGDVDGDGAITIADIIALVDAAYHGGATNCHP